ncbi:hypothetical protein QQF64_014598 [Cirrhinus molitorella]|uniref:L27 domain-containing protein n=1 Tax=Cirrhinus molitorella TaxID=172907 RepID=A0ABR3NTI2_9TELE
MPVRKKDAQRAMLLLEEYRSKLSNTEDRQLRNSIQRVIDIFQSNLFQALIDIQEFYEVTLLDNQRCGELVKVPDAIPPVNLWDFSSIQSTTVTSDTLPSLSTSIEDSPLLNEILHVLAKAKSSPSELDQVSIIPARVWWVGHPPWPHVWAAHFLLPRSPSLVDGVYSKNKGTHVSLRSILLGSPYGSAVDEGHSIIGGKASFGG